MLKFWLICVLISLSYCEIVQSTDAVALLPDFMDGVLAKKVLNLVQLQPNESDIVRGRITTDVVLPCKSFKLGKSRSFSWYNCGLKRRRIGGMNNDGKIETEWTRDGSYRVIYNGTALLLLIGARRELVDRYECVVLHNSGDNETSFTYFRLDFSFWYDHRWDSLFYGSCLSSLVFCAASFILNLVWIVCRKTMLWWINRAERMSRVRSMVEAIEKYRHRQMESLHETYHRRVTAIRENYHQQVDQLRSSYTTQAGRFRGYRQARMDNVTQHLDNIRDNYNQQLSRIRDYGSRRTEQLWENYEHQLNRMRLFTLQQRLKLMRQHQVKQRYINKLLESIADTSNPEVIQKQEAEIREALNLSEELAFPHPTISCSSSYYSLPEFVIEDDLIDSGADVASKTIAVSGSGLKKSAAVHNNQLNMHHHQYQTPVVRLLPRSNGEQSSSMLGSGGGILHSDFSSRTIHINASSKPRKPASRDNSFCGEIDKDFRVCVKDISPKPGLSGLVSFQKIQTKNTGHSELLRTVQEEKKSLL